ncbi:MAG: HAD-IA family hydrolase [Pseudomonadota bacterium]
MLVLFDFDGTLVDSRRRVIDAMTRAYGDHGVPCPGQTAVLSTVGLQPEDMVAVLSPTLERARREAIAKDYRAHSLALHHSDPEPERPFPQAGETLAALKAEGHRLGVVTGKSAAGLDRSLDLLQWRALFDDLQPADNAPGKPDPTLILRAVAALNAHPAETVMVGDTTYDMIMAGRAGVSAIGVGWGYHRPALLMQEGADLVVESFAALAAHLCPEP